MTDISDAATWLKYTYLYTRMTRNPLAYGISADQHHDDPSLDQRCRHIVKEAARSLGQNRMVNYDAEVGSLSMTDWGRVAAHYYLQSESVSLFGQVLDPREVISDARLFRMICSASEFKNMKLRQEELDELKQHLRESCPLPLSGAGAEQDGSATITGPEDKSFVLMQAYISRSRIKGFTLITDMNYISSNVGRVARSVFELCLSKNWADLATRLLRIAKSVDKRLWWFQTPLRQFESELRESAYSSIEEWSPGGRSSDKLESLLSLLDLLPQEVAQICRMTSNSRSDAGGGQKVHRFIRTLPLVEVTSRVQPLTPSLLRVQLTIHPTFQWNQRWHGGAQLFWVFIENEFHERILHFESVTVSHRTATQEIELDTVVPIHSDTPSKFNIRVLSDSWVGIEYSQPVHLSGLRHVMEKKAVTSVLNLSPVPVSCLGNELYQRIYDSKFDYFNPVSYGSVAGPTSE